MTLEEASAASVPFVVVSKARGTRQTVVAYHLPEPVDRTLPELDRVYAVFETGFGVTLTNLLQRFDLAATH